MKTFLTRDGLADLITYVSEAMMASKDSLCELDSIIGDGDLGVTCTLGFGAVKKCAQTGGQADVQALLLGCGMAFADNAASTFGSLMSTMFIRAGRAVKGKTEIWPSEAAAMLQSAVEGIEQRGKAQLGDKTMLDSLIPASLALTKAAAEGHTLPDCLAAACDAAKAGAEETISLRSRAGRSEWMGDRTVGVKDAGAVAVVLLIEAAQRFVNV